MKSVDKLRELPVFGAVSVDGDLNATNQRMVCATKEEILEIADEIEEEFALYSLRNYPKPFGSHEAMHMVLGTAADNFDTPEEAVDYMKGETSMPLPVDADGVPIRVGDKLIAYNERFDVEGVGDGIVIYRNEDDELGELFNPAATVHVKPRTLEDVLVDMLEAAIGYSDAHTDVSLVAVEKYADEIRELLGGDAE